MAEKAIFKEPNEVLEYLKEGAYEDALKGVSSDVLHMIGQLQNTGGCSEENAKKVIAAIEQMPPTAKELIAWRCGDMKGSGKGFVSATLWEDVAKKHQGYHRFSRIHPIVISAGARFLPLVPVNGMLFGLYDDPELEILLDVKHLVKRGSIYQYV
jgi:hypothetical protein